jgi:hypothetical protein
MHFSSLVIISQTTVIASGCPRVESRICAECALKLLSGGYRMIWFVLSLVTRNFYLGSVGWNFRSKLTCAHVLGSGSEGTGNLSDEVSE